MFSNNENWNNSNKSGNQHKHWNSGFIFCEIVPKAYHFYFLGHFFYFFEISFSTFSRSKTTAAGVSFLIVACRFRSAATCSILFGYKCA